ncbi:hypothetical protein XELAEV_18001262mg, partial [Xenopus laevis]
NIDVLHYLWSCPNIRQLWYKIEQLAREKNKIDMVITPLFALLDRKNDLRVEDKDSEFKISEDILNFYFLLMAATRKSIYLHWIKEIPPSLETILSYLYNLCVQEAICCKTGNQKLRECFKGIWSIYLRKIEANKKRFILNFIDSGENSFLL